MSITDYRYIIECSIFQVRTIQIKELCEARLGTGQGGSVTAGMQGEAGQDSE